MLEVIDKGKATREHPTPMLFVHGAYHGAWCWDDHFTDFFAARGYRALAVSLRGHGGSSLSQPMNECSIADYVADVCSVADQLDTPPVIVGHSMGGVVTQKYLEEREAPAGVLVASAPPFGLAATALRTALAHPVRTWRASRGHDMFAVVDAPRLVRQAFFTKSTPESIVLHCSKRLQQESHRALAQDANSRDVVKPDRVKAPLLVLGASDDWMLRPNQVLETARIYNTTATFFAMGHNMMLEPGWEQVAGHIDDWLVHRGL